MINQRRILKVPGSAAIATTLAPGESFQLVAVMCHLSAAGAAGNMTITLDAIAGAAYDAVIVSQDMTDVTSYVNVFEIPIQFDAGDELDIAWANGSTRDYGLTIIYDLL